MRCSAISFGPHQCAVCKVGDYSVDAPTRVCGEWAGVCRVLALLEAVVEVRCSRRQQKTNDEVGWEEANHGAHSPADRGSMHVKRLLAMTRLKQEVSDTAH